MHLVETVRAKAAQLFEIPHRPLERESDLHSRREPYWVTHDVGGLLDPISKGSLGRLLPPSLRSKRVRRALLERIDTLARRNVENVRWALRQNIDDTFRRFGSELDAQLAGMIAAAALHGATRSALAKRRAPSAITRHRCRSGTPFSAGREADVRAGAIGVGGPSARHVELAS